MHHEDLSAGLPEDAPLVALRRGALIESVHRGRVAVCDPQGNVVEAVGNPEGYVYARSSAKPFQALPLVLSGSAESMGLTSEELAVACASHNGEEPHLRAVRSILEKAGLSEADLQNGAHPPLFAPAATELV
ncbi:MAG TPA: asparaginase, partial [Rubrobacteraceae bacterium]|nr:asparaginase [Rubrobacteraceae bacterium]